MATLLTDADIVATESGLIRERIDVYFTDESGCKAHMPIMIRRSMKHTPEQGLVLALGGHFAQGFESFESLAVQRGWKDAYWTYPSGRAQ